MSETLRIYRASSLLLFVFVSGALAQSPESDRGKKMALEMLRRREVPEATLPCTLEEAKWWQELRAAAKAVQEKGASKREKFLHLLREGQEKSYQPPILDGAFIVLRQSEPRYTDDARKMRISGSVALVVEFRADGSVGEVEIAKGLEPSLNEAAAEAARRVVFLPAVKDRKFVPIRMPMVMSFNLY